MNYIKSLSFLVLLLGCSMYSYWLTNKDYEWIVPYINKRSPAAVRESKDYEKIVERPMRVFKREVVASSILIRTHKGQQTFSMGQFPVPTAQGENLICLEYPYMQLTFLGEGGAIGGKKTQVIVSAPCRVNPKNKDYMTTVPLPFNELQRRPAENQEFKVLDPEVPTNIRIENSYGDWPRLWQLENVEFLKDSSGSGDDKITISADELREQLGEPVFVK